MADTFTCPHCQTELSDVDIEKGICPSCGKPIEGSAETIDLDGNNATPTSDSLGDLQTVIDPQAKTVSKPGPDATSSIEQIQEEWGDSVSEDADIGATIDLDDTESQSYSRLNVKEHVFSDAGDEVLPPPDYELIDKLGQGGMGVVYLARQTAIDREIALKMVKGKAAGGDESKNKFLAEAAVTGDLEHPNIVPIYDLGSNSQGHLFYAMKRVQGTSWMDVIQDKPLNENLDILMRVADAIAFAHDKGVIHRDLKPENVMLGDYGEVLVMDWGLAVSYTPDGKAERLTGSTSRSGTPAYMAPEMGRQDGEIGPWSDVYLLGAILYEIVTGLRPHTGDSIWACIYSVQENIIQESPMGGELVDIAMTAMATEPGERYDSVKDFQQAIRDYEAHFESIALCEKAQRDLIRAKEKKDYEVFAQAVYGFRQASELWDDNDEAKKGLSEAQLAYAECALDRSDLDLAASQLDKRTRKHKKLAQVVEKAQQLRIAKQKRLKTLTGVSIAAGILIVVGSVVATVWIAAARNNAVAAQTAEKAQRKSADNARLEAEAERNMARWESYSSQVMLVNAKIRSGERQEPVRLLSDIANSTSTGHLRHWEWGRALALADRGSINFRKPPAPGSSFLRGIPSLAAKGNMLAVPMGDTICVWDLTKLKVVQELPVKGKYIALSPKGDFFAYSRLGTCKITALRKGSPTKTIAGTDPIFAIDSGTLVTSSHEQVLFYKTDGSKRIATASVGAHTLKAVSPSGKFLAVIQQGGLRVFDVASRALISKYRPAQERPTKVGWMSFSPNGTRLVCGYKPTVVGENKGSGFVFRQLKNENAPFYGSFINDRELLLTYFHGYVVRADAVTGARLGIHRFDDYLPIWLSAAPEKNTVFLSTNHNIVAKDLRDSFTDRVNLAGWFFQTRGGARMQFSPQDKHLILTDTATGSSVIADMERRVSMPSSEWAPHSDWEPGLVPSRYNNDVRSFRALSVSADGRYRAALLSKENGTEWKFLVWETKSGKPVLGLPVVKGKPPHIRLSAFIPGRHQILTVGLGPTFRKALISIWDYSTGRKLRQLSIGPIEENFWVTMDLSSDGKLIAFAMAGNRNVSIYNVDSRKVMKVIGVPNLVTGISFSPNSQRLAVAVDIGCRIYSVPEGKAELLLKGHTHCCTSASFSPDGKRLVTAGQDKMVRLWSTDDGKELFAFQVDTTGAPLAVAPVACSVRFSTDGLRLVVAPGYAPIMVLGALDWTKSIEELEAEKLKRWKARWKKERPETKPIKQEKN